MLTETQKAAAEAVAASPSVVTLGGRAYVVPPPTIEDYGALMQEMRRQVMDAAANPVIALNDSVTEIVKAKSAIDPTLLKALSEVAVAAVSSKEKKAEPTGEQCYSQMKTREGLTWWAWFLIRRVDAELTLDAVRKCVPDEAEAFRLSAQLGKLGEHTAISPK